MKYNNYILLGIAFTAPLTVARVRTIVSFTPPKS